MIKEQMSTTDGDLQGYAEDRGELDFSWGFSGRNWRQS